MMFSLVKRRIASAQQRQPPNPPPAPRAPPPPPNPAPVVKLPEKKTADKSSSPLETPPLTPANNGREEGFMEEPSAEDLTAEGVSAFHATVTELVVFKLDEPEISSDESEGTEIATDYDEDIYDFCPRPFFDNKLFWTWSLFWMIVISGILISYHMHMYGYRDEGINLILVPREKWDDSAFFVTEPSVYEAQRVVVVQTETESCDDPKTCAKLLNAMKIRTQKRQQGTLKYNFLISTDGCIYEALGWQEPSPLYPEVRTMVVAFIGTYDKVAPSAMQLNQFYSLLEASQELNCLAKSYTIAGKKINTVPNKLFAYISRFKHWDEKNSDFDDKYMEPEFDPFGIFQE